MGFPQNCTGLGQLEDRKEARVINGTNAQIPRGTVVRFLGFTGDAAPDGVASWASLDAIYGAQNKKYVFVKPVDVAGDAANSDVRNCGILGVMDADLPSRAEGTVILEGQTKILQTAVAVTDGKPLTFNNTGSVKQVTADDSRIIGRALINQANGDPGGASSAAAQLIDCFFNGYPPIGPVVQNCFT